MGKEEFCKLARKMLDDEETGRREYGQLINAADDWKDGASEPEQIEISRILTDITRIRNNESGHALILTNIIESKCKGVQ